MKPSYVLSVVVILVFAGIMYSQIAPSFVGTWRLVSIKAKYESGEIHNAFGEAPIGQIVYGKDGKMSVFVVQADRSPFASGDMRSGTDAEVRAAFEGFLGYYGTYTVDADKGFVTHHIKGSCMPNWVGQDQIRYYRFEGSHLFLTSPTLSLGGKRCELIVDWERAQ